MSKRTDIHRPGAIVPGDYSYVTSYHLATTDGGWPVPPFNIDQVLALQSVEKFAATGSLGKCSVCGASYIYGDVWKHEPTGEHIHIGHECADKYSLLVDRTAFELEVERRKASARRDGQRAANREKRAAFLAAHEGLAEALKVEHPIVTVIAARFESYCELSDRQVALVLKLAVEKSAPAEVEVLVDAPRSEKRVTFRGRVVSAKSHDGTYGTQYRMTVKVEERGGSWLAWGTVPAKLLEAMPVGREGRLAMLRGAVVEVTAALKAGKDPHFALTTRPVAVLVEHSEKARAQLAEDAAEQVESGADAAPAR